MKYSKVYFQFKFIFQYLGSFPVQAADQGDRAEFVRKQLVSMKVIDNRYDIIIYYRMDNINLNKMDFSSTWCNSINV